MVIWARPGFAENPATSNLHGGQRVPDAILMRQVVRWL